MTTPGHIVAIGGSAGSLTPLTRFFDNTPLDGACYIVLQHLPINYKSQLSLILEKHSKLSIIEPTGLTELKKNVVYVAPMGKQLLINNGFLKVVLRVEGPNNSIDTFLESLSQASYGENAVVVLLSCSNDDGVEGSERVKGSGGLILVQDPESCDHSRLSLSVIKRELADFSARAEYMPAIIGGYFKGLTKQDEKVKGALRRPSITNR